jgi:hypothetical protein
MLDSIAAHCELYSLAASLTMRAVRSMAFGKYLGYFFMNPFSKQWEPLQKSGRFRPKVHFLNSTFERSCPRGLVELQSETENRALEQQFFARGVSSRLSFSRALTVPLAESLASRIRDSF